MLLALILAAVPPPPSQPLQRVTICEPDGGSCSGMSEGGSVGLTDAELRATPVSVSGTLTCSGPLTDAQLRAAAVPVSGSFWQTTQPVSIASMPSTPVTGTFWQATQPVSIASMPTTAVTGTFWQSTQPVSLASVPSHAVTGPATNAELRASPLPVFIDGGTVACTIASMPSTPVTGTFWQATQPVSGTFWQATQPVSGTLTCNAGTGTLAVSGPLTDTQLRASAVPVSLASTTITGTVAATQSGTWGARVTGNAGAVLDGPTGSSPPANALLQGLRETTNMVAQVQCDKTAQATISSATETQLVALSGSTVIYVCSAYIEIQGVATTAGTLQLEYGTGTACATGRTAITPTFIGSTTAGNPTVIPMSAGAGYLFKTTAGQALCALSTTTTVQKVLVTYAQF